MLPATIDRNEHFSIVLDDKRGFHALLVVADALGRPEPFVPLWIGTCQDAGTLSALARWLGVRRAQWQDWGKLAERVGAHAFARHMQELIAVEPLGHVVATVVTLQDDPRELTIAEQIQDAAGTRTELIYQHRFANAAARARFNRWFQTGANVDALEAFVQLAYCKGTKSLGVELDRLAGATFATGKRRKPQRRFARATA